MTLEGLYKNVPSHKYGTCVCIDANVFNYSNQTAANGRVHVTFVMNVTVVL